MRKAVANQRLRQIRREATTAVASQRSVEQSSSAARGRTAGQFRHEQRRNRPAHQSGPPDFPLTMRQVQEYRVGRSSLTSERSVRTGHQRREFAGRGSTPDRAVSVSHLQYGRSACFCADGATHVVLAPEAATRRTGTFQTAAPRRRTWPSTNATRGCGRATTPVRTQPALPPAASRRAAGVLPFPQPPPDRRPSLGPLGRPNVARPDQPGSPPVVPWSGVPVEHRWPSRPDQGRPTTCGAGPACRPARTARTVSRSAACGLLP